MIDAAFLAVLRTLHDGLRDHQTSWAITGSTGFALQGLPVTPHDIDLQTSEMGAYVIARHFEAHIVRPVAFSAAPHIRSHFGALRIGGISVEIMGAFRSDCRTAPGSRRWTCRATGAM